jgi:hypothetical protein
MERELRVPFLESLTSWALAQAFSYTRMNKVSDYGIPRHIQLRLNLPFLWDLCRPLWNLTKWTQVPNVSGKNSPRSKAAEIWDQLMRKGQVAQISEHRPYSPWRHHTQYLYGSPQIVPQALLPALLALSYELNAFAVHFFLWTTSQLVIPEQSLN